MAKRTRRKHSATSKAKVVIAALVGDNTLAELSQQFDVHPNQVIQWERQLSAQAANVFDGGTPSESPVDLKTLHAKPKSDN